MRVKYKSGFVQDLLPGDRIVTPKSEFRVVAHHAIYVGLVNYIDSVIENHVKFGVRLISVQAFVKENPEIIRIEVCNADRMQVVNRALSQVGHGYNLLANNCEHTANYAQHNRVFSPQKDFFLIVLGLFGVFALAEMSN